MSGIPGHACRLRPAALAAMLLVLCCDALAASAALPARLCAGLPDCQPGERLDAGRAADGAPLEVLEVRWTAQDADEQACNGGAQAYWLHRGSDDDWRRLLRLCNDGYGAAGVGEDFVEAGAAQLRHQRSGGSNWRWSTETTIGLDPVRVQAVRSDAFLSVASGCHRTLTDPARATRAGWLHPVDDSDENAEIANCDFDEKRPHYRAIPQLGSVFGQEDRAGALRSSFETWRRDQVALGSCALEFSGRDASGFVLHGKPDERAPVTVRVLAVDELHWLVGVQAPGREPAASASWIKDDRLELWIGKFLFTWPHDMEAPRQYGVRLADAKVFPGHNADQSALPTVERWQANGWTWLAIDFSSVQPDYGVFSATVVYGQGDGKSQGLMLGSSRLKFGEATSLGDFWSDYSHDCALRDGAIERTTLRPEYADPDHHDPLARDP